MRPINIISKICIYSLIIFSLYVSINEYNHAASFLFSLLIALGIVLIPLLLCFLVSLIKKQLFHYTLWTIILLIIGLCISFLTLPDSRNSDTPKWNIEASKHFRDKAGIFSWYAATSISTDYKNNYTDSEYYVIKIIYRKGSKKNDNYYIGKVEIDHNYKFSKEIYDKKAISDTDLLKAEFGDLFSTLLLLKNLKACR